MSVGLLTTLDTSQHLWWLEFLLIGNLI